MALPYFLAFFYDLSMWSWCSLGKVCAYDVFDTFFDNRTRVGSHRSLEVVNHSSGLREERDSVDMQKHTSGALCAVWVDVLDVLDVHFYTVRLVVLEAKTGMRGHYLMRTRG
jgi:hypothetical protein